MRRALLIVALLFLASIALIAVLELFTWKSSENLIITTGTRGGIYEKFGEQLKRVLEEYPGKTFGTVDSKESAGTVENMDRLETSEANLALVVGPVFASDPRPGAEAHYRKAGLLGTPPPSFDKRIVTWLQSFWYIATIIVILIGGFSTALKFRRARTGNKFGRRILAVPIGAADPRSADKLMEIRNEIRECVRRRWWQLGKLELDRERWRKLFDLINDRIAESRENMTQALAKEAYAIAIDTDLWHERMRMFEERVSAHFESGDIDASQLQLLREMIRESGLPPSETT